MRRPWECLGIVLLLGAASQAQELKSSTDVVLNSSSDQGFDIAQTVPDALLRTADAMEAAKELTHTATGAATPIGVLSKASLEGIGNVFTAIAIAKMSYTCGSKITRAGEAGLTDCAGEFLDTAIASSLVANPSPYGKIFAAGYSVGQLGQQVLSAATGQPTFNDQWTTYLANQYQDYVARQAEAKELAKHGHTEQSIAHNVAVSGAATEAGKTRKPVCLRTYISREIGPPHPECAEWSK